MKASLFAKLGLLLMMSLSINVQSQTVNDKSPLGINVTGINYWSSQWMLIDVMKQASDGQGHLWAPGNSSTWHTGEYDKLDLDDQGWPKSLPKEDDQTVQYRYVTSIVFGDNHHAPTGRYVVLYDGEGTLEYIGPSKVSSLSSPGRDILNLPKDSALMVRITQTDPNNNGNYLRNIRIISPGGICNRDAFHFANRPSDCEATFTPFEYLYQTQTFHPLFLEDIKRFGSLRFLNMFITNGNGEQTWETRSAFNYATWALGTGAPFETAIKMANKVQAEPWFNVPARVNDDYIKEMAKLIKSQLDGNLSFAIELGNEIWNNAYPYSLDATWMEQQGRATWPQAAVTDFEFRLNYFGMRSAQMCQLFKAEFGAQASRVKCMMGGFVANDWVTDRILSCPLYAQTEGGYVCSKNMYGVAIAPYFAGYFHEDKYLPLWQDWLDNEPEKGFSQLFQEMYDGLLYLRTYDPDEPDWAQAPEHGAIAMTTEFIKRNKQVADKHGIKLTAYEGGQHITFAGNLSGERERINNELFLPANRDPRMGQAMRAIYQTWKEQGGEIFNVFESTATWGRWGAFPLKEYQLQPDSEAPKFAATKGFIEQTPCWWSLCERTTQTPIEYNQTQAPYVNDYDIYGDDDSGTPDPDPTDPEPQTPITLTAEVRPETWGVALTWNATNNDVFAYYIYRDGEFIGHVDATGNHFNNDWLTLNVDYHFVVTAVSQTSEVLAQSNEVVTKAGDSVAPTAVSLSGEPLSDGGNRLSWSTSTDNTGIRFYLIYRNGVQFTHVDGASTSWTDPWPPSGVVSYQVQAVDLYENHSAMSNVTSLPFALTAEPIAEVYGVKLSWSELSQTKYYKIYVDGQLRTHTDGSTSKTIEWLSQHEIHEFYVVAVDDEEHVLATTPIIQSFAGDSEAPSQVTGLQSQSDGAYGFTLSWQPASDNTGVQFYLIYRNGEPYTHVSGDITSFVDEWPPQGTLSYQIVAKDAYHNMSIPSEAVIAR